MRKPSGYWNYERCYTEAKKYKLLSDFRNGEIGAWSAACKKGWLHEYTWLKKRGTTDKPIYVVYYYIDRETNSVYIGLTNNLKRRHRQHCVGHIKHGKRIYDTVYKYFKSANKTIPEPIVLKEKLIASDAQEFENIYIEKFRNEGFNVLNITKGGSLGAGVDKWNYEACYNEAKKYKTRNEFKNGCNSAYLASKRSGWFDDYVWFPFGKTTKKWDYETCYSEAKKYFLLKDFCHNSSGAYNASFEHGWISDYFWLKRVENKWNRENCYDEAKKYKSPTEFKKESAGAYNSAWKNGWLGDYVWFERKITNPPHYWCYETCKEEARKYETRNSFRKAANTAYNVAVKNKWLDDYVWFNEKKKFNYWNHDTCFEESKKYKNRLEMHKKNAWAYEVSRKNGWLDEFFPKNSK